MRRARPLRESNCARVISRYLRVDVRPSAIMRGEMEGPAEQSAAAPSPFPPIADYAFLSNCHTGALVGPDGAVDCRYTWMRDTMFTPPASYCPS
jgi:hypothetical protein